MAQREPLEDTPRFVQGHYAVQKEIVGWRWEATSGARKQSGRTLKKDAAKKAAERWLREMAAKKAG
jgi:hypothetical protein